MIFKKQKGKWCQFKDFSIEIEGIFSKKLSISKGAAIEAFNVMPSSVLPSIF